MKTLTHDDRNDLDDLFARCNVKYSEAMQIAAFDAKAAWQLYDEALREEREGLKKLKIVPTLTGYQKLN